jgi:hypothetical protein
MDKSGLIRYQKGTGADRFTRRDRLGKGTGIPSTVATCYEFDYDQVFEVLRPSEK